MPAPGPNREPITVVELDGRHTVHSAEEWHKLCAELKGMRVCMQFSVLGDRLFKRENVCLEEVENEVS
jgi:hypothetical protein